VPPYFTGSAAAYRWRATDKNLNIPHGFNDGHGRVSISLGGAISSAGAEETALEVLVRGDRSLYEAKRTGRNKAVILD
jgi:GGDEF domain-containing protein